MKKTILPVLAILLSCFTAGAQFYTAGDDPWSIRWSSFKSAHYKMIYPRGLDSLATVYATQLELAWKPVGGSSGYLPGQMYKHVTPVILHAFNADPNGAVTWAPRRMDLYTVPDAYGAEPMPWEQNLAIHESRHVSQMQFGRDGWFRNMHWLTGEIWAGAMAGIYPNTALLEGDAVVAETALSRSGRGRTADFQNWFMVATDQGDWRNWNRWRYGSIRYYTPSYYTTGYLTVAGFRYFYDDPWFTRDYFRTVTSDYKWGFGFRLGILKKTASARTGKAFKPSFQDILEGFHGIWENESAARGPFMETEAVCTPGKKYEAYTGGAFAGSRYFIARKSGLNHPTELVRFGADGEIRLRAFNPTSSKLTSSEDRIWWSETVPDPRWTLKKSSVIRYMSAVDGKVRNLTSKGRLFNPVPLEGGLVAAVDYPVEGGSAIVLLDAESGIEKERYPAPGSIQFTEAGWFEGRLYASGITEDGYGLWSFCGDNWKTELEPQPVKVKGLRSYEDGLYFTCDRTGVNEIYRWNGKELIQLTNSRYGSSDFSLNPARDTLWFSSLCKDGLMLHSAAVADLPSKTALWSEIHAYPVADKLSLQEEWIAAQDSTWEADLDFGPVKRYNKLLHLPNLHSWAPFYFNYDAVESLSLDAISTTLSLGATALFQNHLGTAYGFVGWGTHKHDGSDKWQNVLHANITYTGLYPVLEFNLDWNNRDAIQYGWKTVRSNITSVTSAWGRYMSGTPHLTGSLLAYIPWNFSSGGWQRGLIPQVKWSFSNDFFNSSEIETTTKGSFGSNALTRFARAGEGRNSIMQSVTVSARGYSMLSAANSSPYPALGLGLEAGFRTRIGLGKVFSPAEYAYAYGYLPGIIPEHGIRITAIAQYLHTAAFMENCVSTQPRGFYGCDLSSWLAANQNNQLKITMDYSMYLLPVEWDLLCPFIYITNFVLTPHADWSPVYCGNLFSTGVDLSANLGKFLFFPNGTKIGVSWSWNSGSAFDKIESSGVSLDRNYLRAIFSTSF